MRVGLRTTNDNVGTEENEVGVLRDDRLDITGCVKGEQLEVGLAGSENDLCLSGQRCCGQ